MASAQPQWEWDTARQKYYYIHPEKRCWVYQDGEIVSGNHDGEYNRGRQLSTAAGAYATDLLDKLQLVQDTELYYCPNPLFTSSPSLLHYIDPRKEHISLLACQHLLRPVSRACPELWMHTHPYLGNSRPSMGLYLQRGTDEQTLVIDLGGVYMSTHTLTEMLREATKSYRDWMSRQMGYSYADNQSWEKFHGTELRHLKWLKVYSKPSAEHALQFVTPGEFFVSGVTCPNCKRWTKLGSNCSRCSEPLEDQSSVKAEGAIEVGIAEGSVGTTTILATAGAYVFLSLLAMQ